MQLALGSAAQHRLLVGLLPASLTPGPVSVTAHVFTQPGSLISVFAKLQQSPAPGTFALDVRIPEPLLHAPVLVRVSTPTGFYLGLVAPSDSDDTVLSVAALDDTSTVVAQIYAAARASQSWPRGEGPEVLAAIISPELASAMRQAPNAERTLAAVTQGVVAAVCAWQGVLRHGGLGRSRADEAGALVASLVWHSATGQLTSGADSTALSEARRHARCVDCLAPAGQLALAAQAGADAWLVYADKLPWALRSQALVDAAALQAHFMVAMVDQAQSSAQSAEMACASSTLTKAIDAARRSAPTVSPTTTARALRLAWQAYTEAVWAHIDANSAERRLFWDQSSAGFAPAIAALREMRSGLNSRVAPAQAAAHVADGYVQMFQAMQLAVRGAQSPLGLDARLRLSAALTLRGSLIVAGP